MYITTTGNDMQQRKTQKLEKRDKREEHRKAEQSKNEHTDSVKNQETAREHRR
jgi:hypothetical protein